MHNSSNINICTLLRKGDILLCIILYLLINLNCFGYTGWVRCYGNDIIAGYVFCYITQELHYKFLNIYLDNKLQFELLILASIYWEFIYPIFSNNSTTDIYDIGAYVVGYIVFTLFKMIKKNNKKYNGLRRTGNEKII